MEPLSPARATSFIRSKHGPTLELQLTRHAKERMFERGLIMGDVLHVIKHGFVHEPGGEATRLGCFKYKMECVTPNSGGRTVRLVLIPSQTDAVKVVTVMWADESG